MHCLHTDLFMIVHLDSVALKKVVFGNISMSGNPIGADRTTASTLPPRASVCPKPIYRMSQEKRSIFWEVIVSVILRKKCIYTCVLFGTVSEIELFHCTPPKL
jgi:hypothetical protein